MTSYINISTTDLITINKNEAGMEFTKNVNDIQRDQYVTDKTSGIKNQPTGYLTNIQGEKTNLSGNAVHKTVKPRLKVIFQFESFKSNQLLLELGCGLE